MIWWYGTFNSKCSLWHLYIVTLGSYRTVIRYKSSLKSCKSRKKWNSNNILRKKILRKWNKHTTEKGMGYCMLIHKQKFKLSSISYKKIDKTSDCVQQEYVTLHYLVWKPTQRTHEHMNEIQVITVENVTVSQSGWQLHINSARDRELKQFSLRIKLLFDCSPRARTASPGRTLFHTERLILISHNWY